MHRDIVYEIIKNTPNLYSLRLVNSVFKSEFDKLYSYRWNHEKLCINVTHRMDINIDIIQIRFKHIQDWVFDVIKPCDYSELVHSANVIKWSYTMKNIVVSPRDLNKLDRFDLSRIDWDKISGKMSVEELYEYAGYIDDWSKIEIKPIPEMLRKCHNKSMFLYLQKHIDIYRMLIPEDMDRLLDLLDWANVVSRSDYSCWEKYINIIDWHSVSWTVFANNLNEKYIDWSIYSVRGLTDEDFIKREHLIYTEQIEEVNLCDISLIKRHFRLYGLCPKIYRIMVNGEEFKHKNR